MSADAAANLRYLATTAAIEDMTGRVREGYTYFTNESSLGLLGLPDSMRDVAIASMNQRIEQLDFPISPLFFKTMSLLHVRSGSNAESIRQQRQSFDTVLWQTIFSSIPEEGTLGASRNGANAAWSLLVRFGTGAATSQMIVKLNEPSRPYACMAHALALAYLVRFSPDDARPLLKRVHVADDFECKNAKDLYCDGSPTTVRLPS